MAIAASDRALEADQVDALSSIIQRFNCRGVTDTSGRNWLQWLRSRRDVQAALNKVGYAPAGHTLDTLQAFIADLPDQEQASAQHCLKRALRSRVSLDELRARMGVVAGSAEVKPNKRVRRAARLVSLVQQTRAHPRFEESYHFPSEKANWANAPQTPNKGKHHIHGTDLLRVEDLLMSMDCEMVATQEDDHALARVCVCTVDGGLVLDRLVKPPGKIIDPRTHITGLSIEDLEDVDYTVADAQAELRKLLTPHTVMIGHSLNNDLAALRLECPLVVDTAFLFGLEGCPLTRLPSLKHLVEKVLGNKSFRGDNGQGVHDCGDDAQAALDVVLHRLRMSSEDGGDEPVIWLEPPESPKPMEIRVETNEELDADAKTITLSTTLANKKRCSEQLTSKSGVMDDAGVHDGDLLTQRKKKRKEECKMAENSRATSGANLASLKKEFKKWLKARTEQGDDVDTFKTWLRVYVNSF